MFHNYLLCHREIKTKNIYKKKKITACKKIWRRRLVCRSTTWLLSNATAPGLRLSCETPDSGAFIIRAVSARARPHARAFFSSYVWCVWLCDVCVCVVCVCVRILPIRRRNPFKYNGAWSAATRRWVALFNFTPKQPPGGEYYEDCRHKHFDKQFVLLS